MRLLARVGVALLAAAVSSGATCAQTKTKDTLERLKESVEGYNHAFRWKNYERAAIFIPQDLRAAFVAAYEDDETSLQIEDYTVVKVDLIDEKSAKVSVNVRYLLLPSVVVQKALLQQEWHEVDGQWILETEKNSIRPLDPTATPKDPRSAPAAPVDPKNEGDTQVDVEFERP